MLFYRKAHINRFRCIEGGWFNHVYGNNKYTHYYIINWFIGNCYLSSRECFISTRHMLLVSIISGSRMHRAVRSTSGKIFWSIDFFIFLINGLLYNATPKKFRGFYWAVQYQRLSVMFTNASQRSNILPMMLNASQRSNILPMMLNASLRSNILPMM